MQPLLEGGVYRPGPGGTTTCVVADRWGNLVAATPSCNVFGVKGDGGVTGVTHGNRLRCLNTTAGHSNCIQPGKRPCITLTPTIVLQEGRPVLGISVAGGDLQDQTTLNIFLNWLTFGMLPEQAVTAPRFATQHHQNSFDPHPDRRASFLEAGSLIVNQGIDAQVREELARRGHQLTVRERQIANPVMVYLDRESEIIYAAGDPMAKRHAAGL